MKKAILITLTSFVLIFCTSQVSFAKKHIKFGCGEHSKKYQICCTDKKVLFKSWRCKNYICPSQNSFPGVGKPAIYLYPNGDKSRNIMIPGSKPAVYLYTPKPLKVHITLDKSVLITYDAPRYAPGIGWNVLAYPDGRIEDLQPQYTDCNRFDKDKFGLEYAPKACKENHYPYIFWEGNMTKKPLPVSQKGWIVETNKLQGFFNEKLDYIGFNKAEKDEFIEYWTKVLAEKQVKSYFIYFLQTKEVNDLAPMQVTPNPDSINRLYMIALPANSDMQKPQPQQLGKFRRKGFTLIEWGGILDHKIILDKSTIY